MEKAPPTDQSQIQRSLCPYCPQCAEENGEDVFDFAFQHYPYCEKHHPTGVIKPSKENKDRGNVQ